VAQVNRGDLLMRFVGDKRRSLVSFLILLLMAILITIPLISIGCTTTAPQQETEGDTEQKEKEEDETEEDGEEGEQETGTSQMAFIRDGDVYLFDLGSGSVGRLTSLGTVTALAVKRDGSELAMATHTMDTEGYYAVETMNIDGSGRREILREQYEEGIVSLSYTPDGAYIYYTLHPHQVIFGHVSRVNTVTGAVDDLDTFKEYEDHVETFGFASVSPDGGKLACQHFFFAKDPGSGAIIGVSQAKLCLMNLDGSDPVDLANITLDPSDINLSAPAWSFDAASIAYIGQEEQVWRIDSEGSSPFKLTDTGTGCGYPDWDPGGDLLTFTLGAGYCPPSGALYSVPSAGGTPSDIMAGSTGCSGRWMLLP
jgi:Tol biopolymer transport system component